MPNWRIDESPRREALVIVPRPDQDAHEIAKFLREQFQQPGQCDGNPLINAELFYTTVKRDAS